MGSVSSARNIVITHYEKGLESLGVDWRGNRLALPSAPSGWGEMRSEVMRLGATRSPGNGMRATGMDL
jgi:hypothetical protein